jgi:hypothetical protein
VGEDHIVYSGEVKAITDGIGVWLTQYNLNNMFNTVDYNYSGSVDSIFFSNGMITIQGDSGVIVVSAYELPYTVQDGNGTTYTLMPDGTVVIQNPVPHIPLTQAQKNVYLLALAKMRNENSLAYIAQLENTNNQNRDALRNKINTDYGIDYTTTQPASPNDLVVMEVIYYDSASPVTQPMNEEIAARQAEFNLIKAKVCRTFSKPNPSTFDLDLLANFLYMDGQPSHLYIAAQLQAERSEADLADEVKAVLDLFIEQLLYERAFTKPTSK